MGTIFLMLAPNLVTAASVYHCSTEDNISKIRIEVIGNGKVKINEVDTAKMIKKDIIKKDGVTFYNFDGDSTSKKITSIGDGVKGNEVKLYLTDKLIKDNANESISIFTINKQASSDSSNEISFTCLPRQFLTFDDIYFKTSSEATVWLSKKSKKYPTLVNFKYEHPLITGSEVDLNYYKTLKLDSEYFGKVHIGLFADQYKFESNFYLSLLVKIDDDKTEKSTEVKTILEKKLQKLLEKLKLQNTKGTLNSKVRKNYKNETEVLASFIAPLMNGETDTEAVGSKDFFYIHADELYHISKIAD